jgi:hypothetical protein
MLKIKELFCKHNYQFKKYEVEEIVVPDATINPKPTLLKPQNVSKYYWKCTKCGRAK